MGDRIETRDRVKSTLATCEIDMQSMMKATIAAARTGVQANHRMGRKEATQKLERERGFTTAAGSTQSLFRGSRHK